MDNTLKLHVAKRIGLILLTILALVNAYLNVILTRVSRQVAGRRERPLSSYCEHPSSILGSGSSDYSYMAAQPF